jgi:hypothetical protein
MKHITILFCFVLLSGNIFAQSISPEIHAQKWTAYWITETNAFDDYGVYHFRKKFHIADKPSSFIVHVSADNRYKLYVNGELVSLGPTRGDMFHWNFETVDLAPYLNAGNNCIAAVVWNFSKQKPEAQLSYRTAFILQGNTAQEAIIDTNASWKCFLNQSYTALSPDLIYTYYVAGPGEKINYALHPTGWELFSFDDGGWNSSKELFHGLPKGAFDWSTGWMLVPSSIPASERKPQRFKTVRSVEGISLKGDLKNKFSFRVPANTKVVLLIDQGELTNAYPVLRFGKGKNAHVQIGYAEALYVREAGQNWKFQKQKGNRNEIEGKRFVGVKDELVGNGETQTFTSLDWRTFRYVQLEIETADEECIIDDFFSVFTGYPFNLKATFTSSDPALKKVMETGWRTSRLCAVETYMDCPYYERLQYVGDTRIQAMVSLYNSGDDRLMRNAITLLDNSRMAEGITLSRFPTVQAQQIPTFSLWWIQMVSDYYRYQDDTTFVKKFLPGIRQVLTFFAAHQQEDGSLKQAPYWNFTDWVEGRGWTNGVPPVGIDGNSSILDLQLLMGYQTAALLEKDLGSKENAQTYNAKAMQLKHVIMLKYWDENKHKFADTSEKKYYSQHANALAILSGVAFSEQAHQIASKLLNDTSLTQATIYFKYYTHQAIAMAGLGNAYLKQLQVWKQNLDFGLTTWAEISDINNARSDCHAWGASPNIEFFRIVLGIDSDAPGFNKIRIQPHLGDLSHASGSMPHPRGEVVVRYTMNKDKLKAELTIPFMTSGVFVWKGKQYALQPGINVFSDL